MLIHALLIATLIPAAHPFAVLNPSPATAEPTPTASPDPDRSVDPVWMQYLGRVVAITLSDGSALFGTVTAIEPEGLTCQIGDGSPRKLAFAEIATIELRDAGPAAMSQQGSGSADARASGDGPVRTPQPGAPRLHISLSREANVVLYQVTSSFVASGTGGSASGMSFQQVCAAPCDEVVDGRDGRAFFISGEGVTKSGGFTLVGRDGDVELAVRPGRAGVWFGGVVLTGLGILPAALSAVPFARGRDGAGGAMIGIGVGMIIGGIIMIVRGVTRVKLAPRGQSRRNHPMSLRWG